MTTSKPPMEPETITKKLRDHFDKLEEHVKVNALRREHVTTRSELHLATADLRRWREVVNRASYRRAVAWIAENDSAGADGADDPYAVAELVSSALVADLFGVAPLRIGQDVVRFRKKEQGAG